MKYIEIIMITFVVLIIIILTASWNVFKYKECKKVGHSKTYCILNIGSK